MKFKKTILSLFVSSLLAGTSTPTLAMWGEADEEAAETSRQVKIKEQLEELESSVGAELKDNMLHVSLNEDNQVDLAFAFGASVELLNHYNVHLDYEAPVAQGHLRLLRCLNKLTSLKLSKQILNVTKGEVLSQILSQHSTLTKLDFSKDKNFTLTDEGLIAIQQSMNSLSYLNILNLEGQKNIGDRGFIILSNILSNIISLKELNLSDMNIDTKEMAFLAPLARLTNLKQINLSQNNLEGNCLVSLRNLSALTELNLSSNQITSKKLRILPKSQIKTPLKILDLSYNRLTDEGIAYVSMLLNLLTLNVSNNEDITLEGVKELSNCQNLTSLNLSNNRIEKNCLTFLESLANLVELYLSCARINDKQLRELSRSQFKDSLRILNVSGNQIEDEGAFHISLLPNLAVLDISTNNITSEGLSELLDLQNLTFLNSERNNIKLNEVSTSLSQHPRLKTLHVDCHACDKTDLRMLAKNTSLAELSLNNLEIRSSTFCTFLNTTNIVRKLDISAQLTQELANCLSNASSLRTLILTYCDVEDDGVKILAKNNLEILNLSNNKIGDNGAQALATNTALKSLILDANKVGNDGAQALFKMANLTRLHLENNQIKSYTGYALVNNTNLKELRLSGNSIGDDWIQGMVNNTTLTSLHLFNSRIETRGAQILAANTTLIKLYLSNNNIGDEGAMAFACNSTLRELNLGRNNIGNKGAQTLANTKSLIMLDLRDNQIGDSGACSLARNESLKKLYLSNNQIGDDGAEYFARNKTLLFLSLCLNKNIEKKGKKALRNSRNKNIQNSTNY